MGVLMYRFHFRGGRPYQRFYCFLFTRQRWEAAAQVISRARPIVEARSSIPPTPTWFIPFSTPYERDGYLTFF